MVGVLSQGCVRAAVLRRRGVAIVAVLGILSVLALMMVAVAVMTQMELVSVRSRMARLDAHMLAESGMAHARAVLWYDTMRTDPRYDAPGAAWMTCFNGVAVQRPAEVAMDANHRNGPRGDGADSVWINMFDSRNVLVGRYAVMVEDECGKININAAMMVPPRLAHQGLSTREILLGDGGSRGLPLPRRALDNLSRYKLGANGVPGAAGDDNHNNALLMADGLDNDADGSVDERDEGVDELDEYLPWHPVGDDRALCTMPEAWRVAMPDTPATKAAMAPLRACGTLVSRDRGVRWDDAKGGWVPRQNLNIAAARDIHRALARASRQFNISGDTRQIRRLAAIAADCRDENSALSTVAGDYGVESVCFNEVLANEGSKIRQTYYVQNYRRDDIRVHNLAYLYSDYNFRSSGDLQDDNPAHRERGHGDTAWAIRQDNVARAEGGLRLRLDAAPWSNPNGYGNCVADFKSLLAARGSGTIKDNAIVWPENIWAGAYLCAFTFHNSQVKSTPEKAFRIARSTGRDIYIDGSGLALDDFGKFTTAYHFAQIRSWTFEKAYYAEHPQVSDWFVFSGLQQDKYYRVYIQETNLETPTGDKTGGQRLADAMDVDGDCTRYTEQKMRRLRYRYKDGTCLRADRKGCVDVVVTSARTCSPKRRNRFNAAYIARPDIIELTNMGDKPLSLRGWRLIANTGSLAYDLGAINEAARFSDEDGGRRVEENPVIPPRGYFYLSNNAEAFDREYGGSQNGLWGSSADEQIPLHEIDDDRWGVRFRIKSVRETGGTDGVQAWSYVACDNETWEPHQFEQEVVEFQSDRKSPDGMSTSPDGVRALVSDNTRNTLSFESLLLEKYSAVRAGDYAMIVGLPRVGGMVSMTLKNEYGQIASRLVKYGNPGDEAKRSPDKWLGWSSEKPNPAREEWLLVSTPSFGGTPQKARNRSARMVEPAAGVRNGPYPSVAGIEHARRIAACDRAEDAARGDDAARLMRGVAEYFDVSGLRLEAEEEGAHLAGWLPAFGTATVADARSITDRNAAWQVGMWSNQTVRILSGCQRGESFAIVGNSPTSARIVGRSVPGRMTCSVHAGDGYALGPPYASPMCYSRTDNDAGEWEWKNRHISPGTYALYLAGLNDSMLSTEFLEENHNARLDVMAYNFTSNSYDALGTRLRYGKNDCLCAGNVQACHLSPSGGIRLKIVAHGLNNRQCRGSAWLDYAYLTPMPVEGRINVNTASPRVLAALNGVNDALASNIVRGIDAAGLARLKPYRSPGDVLCVSGMTPGIFAGMANMITVRSDQFSVHVVAQRVTDVNHDGVFDGKAGDRVEAVARRCCALDRSGLRDGGPFRTIEAE